MTAAATPVRTNAVPHHRYVTGNGRSFVHDRSMSDTPRQPVEGDLRPEARMLARIRSEHEQCFAPPYADVSWLIQRIDELCAPDPLRVGVAREEWDELIAAAKEVVTGELTAEKCQRLAAIVGRVA